MLNEQQFTKPSCIESWFEKYFIDFSDTKWKTVFTLARNLTKDTKLIILQFKILHRVYASKSYVSNFDPTVNKDCQICNVENNVVHFFTTCTLVKRFWILVNEWLSTLENVNTPLSVANIIFGIHSITSFNVNFVKLHAKWFIHCNRESNNNVNLTTL